MIQFGNMECGDMLHMGSDIVIKALMTYSASPIARKLVEDVLVTDEPYHINIQLTAEATNRNVEILNAYLKTMGLRLVFKRVPKQLQDVFEPIELVEPIEKKQDENIIMEKMTGNEVKAFIEMIDEYIADGGMKEDNTVLTVDIMDEMYEWEVEKLLAAEDIMAEIDSLGSYSIMDAVEKEVKSNSRDLINYFVSK